MRAAPGSCLLGWGSVCVRLGAGHGAACGYEGRGVAPFPPFPAGGCPVCPGVGWDVAPPFLVAFAGGARGLGFPLYPAGLALAVSRAVLYRFPLTPPRGVSFPQLECVVALCGAGGPSLVPGACPVRRGGPFSTWVVVSFCLSRGAVPSAVGGCVGVAVGGGFPPFFFFFPAFPVGNLLSVVEGGCRLVACWSLLPVPGRAPPPPLRTSFFFPRPVVCLFPGRGVCRRVRGVSSSELSAAVWSWWAALCDRASSGCAGWSFGVLLAGHVGVAHGVARLGGGCPPRRWGFVALRLCGCPSRFPPFPLGGGCAFLGWGGLFGRFLFMYGWGFPPSLSCWFSFGGGGCLFLPLPSLSMHWLVSGVLNWLAVRVAGGRGLCPCSLRLVA